MISGDRSNQISATVDALILDLRSSAQSAEVPESLESKQAPKSFASHRTLVVKPTSNCILSRCEVWKVRGSEGAPSSRCSEVIRRFRRFTQSGFAGGLIPH